MNAAPFEAQYAARIDREKYQFKYPLVAKNLKDTEDYAKNLSAGLKRLQKLCRMKTQKQFSNSGKVLEQKFLE